MKKWLTIIITIGILVSLYFFLQATDMNQVMKSVSHVGYRFVVLILVTGIAYLLGTLSWQYCLGDKHRAVSLGRLYLIRHVGETFTLFNPASVVGGDSLKAVMLSKYGIDSKRAAASVLLSRLMMMASQLTLFLSSFVAMMIQLPMLKVFDANLQTSAISPFLAAKSKSLRVKVMNFVREVPPLIRENRKFMWLSVLFAVLHWIFGALEFYFILKFLNIDITIVQALVIDLGVVFFKTAGAFVPGQIGFEEYGNKIMLSIVGVSSAEVWVTASILRRARQLVWIGLGVAFYFIFFSKKQQPEEEPELIEESGNTIYKP
ncbi:lysylphosphatidylglycerol synthase transmembrane domain-containing protein [Albibacterium indicum]|uniref:lysylphosphatidylglycerol synthase transmembrane domain-containing protein n=1 Tax=Albibacterium indicum TaxID=2292082 RepID=UPI000E4CF1CB|nr:lysylphosphatidylglycerol synthase transmembrane domain-containing protein [Pedobacter indicus]